MNKKINPVYFYFILWIGVLYLFTLKFSNLLLDINTKTLIYLIGSSFLFAVPALILSFYTYNYHQGKINSTVRLRNVKPILYFLIICICFEITSFGLFPFFGLLGFNTKRYTEWGFKGFHGLLNGILMAYTIINFGLYLKTKTRRYFIRFLLGCLWPILLLTRQMLMSIFVQIFLCIIIL